MDRWIVILTLGQLAFVGFIIWVISRARVARMRQQSEERSRLLERFSSSQELTQFLNSEAGPGSCRRRRSRTIPPAWSP